MAVRRMIHQDVICCDKFLDLEYEAQALFFQLQIRADEYGFVGSPRSTLRMLGASNEALEALIQGGFVICFDSGVIAMCHWNKANTRRGDREIKVNYPEELDQLRVDDQGVYHMREDADTPVTSQRRDKGLPLSCQRDSSVVTSYNLNKRNKKENNINTTKDQIPGTCEKPPENSLDDIGEPTGFSDFWEAYPRKVARQDALKAWKALKVDTSLTETIIADVCRRRAADWRRVDVRYIPYPASYLRGRRWEDQETTDEGRKGTNGDSYGGDPVILTDEEEAAIARINADGLNYG